MSEEATRLSKEDVDSFLARLSELSYEVAYDTTLTTKYDLIPAFCKDTLFSDEQRAQVLQVLSPSEVINIDHKYRDALTRLAKEITLANDVRIDANRRAVFISRVSQALQSMQSYVANVERVIARLEQEIESLELALAYDQERECY